MATTIKAMRLFIASPGGLQKERRTFRELVEEFNRSDAVHRGLQFIPVGWEDTLETAGRPQELINSDLEKSDYCVFVLWDRWGSSPGSSAVPFTSGTEEEFHIAQRALAERTLPMKQILVLFKGVSAAQLSDPGPQLRRVLDFRQKIETEKQHIYHHFDDTVEFERLLRRFLSKWTRDQELTDEGKSTVGEGAATVTGSSNVDEELRLAEAAVRLSDAESVARYGLYLARIQRWSRARFAFEFVRRLLDGQATHTGSIHQLVRSLVEELSKDEAGRQGRIVFGGRTVHIDNFLISLTRESSGGHYLPTIGEDIRLDVAQEYGGLSKTFTDAGLLELALELQHRRLAILRSQEALHAKEPEWFVQRKIECLTDVAIINCFVGNYKMAERFAREAMVIAASGELGNEPFIRRPSNPAIAITNHNLGIILANAGEYEGARELLESARSYWAEVYGDGVGLQRPRREPVEAGGFAVAIESGPMSQENIVRGDNLWAASHAGIGLVYFHQQEFSVAEKFHFEAQLRVGYFGEIAPAIANNLGAIYYLTGRMQLARQCFKQSFAAQRGGLAKKARTLRNLVLATQEQVRAEDVLASNELADLLNRYSKLRSTDIDISSL